MIIIIFSIKKPIQSRPKLLKIKNKYQIDGLQVSVQKVLPLGYWRKTNNFLLKTHFKLSRNSPLTLPIPLLDDILEH